ncbi:hypothetical protein ACLB2K_077409 [Fragaria x ananassa]
MGHFSLAKVMVGKGRETTINRKDSKGGWNAAIFIIFVEAAERFAYYGLSGNLTMYLTNYLHQPTAVAAKNVNTWVGVSSLFALLGAIVGDCFLGRFRTIILSTSIYFMGMVLLCLSVSIVPSHYREVVFFIALYILSVGEGGHKPCVQTFAADQFDEDTAEQKEKKSSFFNWCYLAIVVAGTSSTLLVIYIQVDTASFSTYPSASVSFNFSFINVVIGSGSMAGVMPGWGYACYP